MAASRTCPSCGAVNNASNLFCIHCGRSLTAPGGPPSPAPGYPVGQPPGVPPPAGVYPYFGPPPRRATFSSILSGMFDVWTKGFKGFFVVFFILGLVTGVIGALFTYAVFRTFEPTSSFLPGSPPEGVPPVNLGNLVLFGILVAVGNIILDSIVIGGMAEYSVRRFRGETIPVAQALRRGLEKFLSILGANFLLGLLIFAVILLPLFLLLPFAVPGVAVDPRSALALVCGAATLFVVGGLFTLYIGIAMSLYAPAIMMEDTNAVGGLSRSWRITKGHWWSLFAAFLVTIILALIITAIITVPVAFLNIAAVSIVAGALAEGIIGAWVFIVPAVTYDLIVREPTYFAPPYYPGPGPATPSGTGQPPQPPAAPPTGP